MYDIIIIGSGPAGISAALYAKRTGANVLVLYYGTAELEKASKIDNYYGFTNGITGEDLYKNGIMQAKNIGVEVLEREIIDIEIGENSCYKVISPKESFETKSIIIATGNKRIKPNIKGINELEGKGISYCAICDGFFYRNKNVAVIGNGEFAVNEANTLKNVVNTIKILTNGMPKPEVVEYEVDTRKIKEIHGQEKVENIEFEDGETLEVDGIFIAEGIAGRNKLCKKTWDNNKR